MFAMQKKRMLVLTPRFPYPLYGGDVLRIYRLCESLTEHWSMTLLSICQTEQEMAAQLPEGHPFTTVHRVYLPKWLSVMNALQAMIVGQPLQIAYYASRRFGNMVRQFQPEHDAILCHLVRTAPYAQRFDGLRLLEATDHLPLTYARSNAMGGKTWSLKRLAYQLEQTRIDLAQNRLAAAFDLVTFVSDIDRKLFLESSRLPAGRVETFANGVSILDRPFRGNRVGHLIAFVGNMRAMPNADAVAYFIEAVLPLILHNSPDAQLKVVGAFDAHFVAQFSKHENVSFVGTVPNLASALDACCVGVCPVRIGAGVQNKMLDYMSLGLASVTTSLGAEGIDGKAGTHFLTADAAPDFAAAVVSLFQDDSLRYRIASAGRQAIEQNYSWQSRLEGLPRRIDSADQQRALRKAP
jgi:glycosyltransferase involved in cell wall biosynthesis